MTATQTARETFDALTARADTLTDDDDMKYPW